MEDEEDPPLAVEIGSTITAAERHEDDGVSVGVTVITGYLGAGKSTLVNYILNSQHGKRIAVILNEFGEEIGVERAMINEGDGGALVEEWVELANGCICCTVKHSLVQALEQLVQRKERLDHILLETTGLANPAPLASVLWLDDQLESSIKLDSIITVVDAKNLHFQLNEHRSSSSFPEAFHQIAYAVHSWLEEILWEKKGGMDVYRCKGVLSIKNSDKLHTLQVDYVLKGLLGMIFQEYLSSWKIILNRLLYQPSSYCPNVPSFGSEGIIRDRSYSPME